MVHMSALELEIFHHSRCTANCTLQKENNHQRTSICCRENSDDQTELIPALLFFAQIYDMEKIIHPECPDSEFEFL